MYVVAGEPMTEAAQQAINASAAAPLYVSPITAWEVGMMAGKGRFRSPVTPQRWFESLCALPGISLCALTAEILMQSWSLPRGLNKDPADRIIAATAREYGFTVMTRDRALLDYGRQGYLSVMEC
jgi:PIN domain nuclease of toxin-antitoxin system